jgi:serine protease Do
MIVSFGEIGERLRRSTVGVELGPNGAGSGVIWDSSGLVITNAHVAQESRTVQVALWDGRRYEAQVINRDHPRDLAALRFRAPDLTPAEIGDSSKLQAGEIVIAVGNPLGFTGALSTGVVHAVGPFQGLSPREYVQANVRLMPGNSGGPLADSRGRVIGINAMVASGLALAIPTSAVANFLHGKRRAELGISVRPVTVRFRSKMAPGLVILDVGAGSPAAQASLMVGDVIIGGGGKLFQTFDDLSYALELNDGAVRVQFLRGDRRSIRETTAYVEAKEQAA